jgi:single-strand DNA-binding protein
MANFNKVILAGNLTRDPQLSFLPNSTPVCEFGMAINRKWKSQNGEMKEEVCFVDLTAFGRPAETINQYMKKGQPMLVDGRLKYHQWEGKDGQKKSRLTVVVDNFQFLSSGGGVNRGGERSTVSAPRSQAIDEMPPMDEPAAAPTGEDIPF